MARHDRAPDDALWHDDIDSIQAQHKARARRGRRRQRRTGMRPMDAYRPRIRDKTWATKTFFKRRHHRVGRYGWSTHRIR